MNIHVVRRKGSTSVVSEEFELELQTLIASNVEDSIFTNIAHYIGLFSNCCMEFTKLISTRCILSFKTFGLIMNYTCVKI